MSEAITIKQAVEKDIYVTEEILNIKRKERFYL